MLTGLPVGAQGPDGAFAPGSVDAAVAAALERMGAAARSFALDRMR